MDVLSEILRLVKLEGAFFFCCVVLRAVVHESVASGRPSSTTS